MPFIPTDALRVLAVLAVAPAAIGHGFVGFAVMFLVAGGTMLPRALGTVEWLDAVLCAAFLFAAWAALLDWYVAVSWLDLVVHAVVTGLLGVLAWEVTRWSGLLTRDSVRARIAAAVVTITSASTLAVLWEIGEWLGHTRLDDSIQVGYTDTMTDLVAGVLGAVGAGLLAALAVDPPRDRSDEAHEHGPLGARP